MEFNWNNPPFEMDSSLTPRDIEESFEDPFAVRLLPDTPRFSVQARFFNLGMSRRFLLPYFEKVCRNRNYFSGLIEENIRKRRSSVDRLIVQDSCKLTHRPH